MRASRSPSGSDPSTSRMRGSSAARRGARRGGGSSGGRPALATYAGKQVAVGLRPEYLEDAALLGGEQARLQGEVLFAESLGSERLVHVAVEGKSVITDEVLEIAAD